MVPTMVLRHSACMVKRHGACKDRRHSALGYLGLVPYHHLSLVVGDCSVLPLNLTLEVLEDHLAHPDPQTVHQV